MNMSNTGKIRIAILGASGYTGSELLRILLRHPNASLNALTAEKNAGQAVAAVLPHFAFETLPDLIKIDAVDWKNVDLAFCCLPHGTTQEVIAAIPKNVKVIDLSADFRLTSLEGYATWYGHAHRAVELQKEAVYGLTEINRAKIKQARLVANPGCYPTSAQLPLIPLLKAKLISADDIVIDSKSGITGAGRDLKQGNLYAEASEGIHAYGIAQHRHAPEIEQGLTEAVGKAVKTTFTPHLMPMNRGILSTIYVKLSPGKTADDLRAELEKTYSGERFVKILRTGAPATRFVRGTNDCVIGVYADRVEGRAIIISAIDNLVKGASGQAVQNMNAMYGWPEATGLEALALFP
jgi:N-acetyl-gamma-glutamyl-phosphate reductase